MNGVDFKIERSVVMAQADFAVVDASDDPAEALVEAVIHSIAVNIEVTIRGVTMHLAAWMDPEHWSSDWQAQGVEYPHAWIANSVSVRP